MGPRHKKFLNPSPWGSEVEGGGDEEASSPLLLGADTACGATDGLMNRGPRSLRRFFNLIAALVLILGVLYLAIADVALFVFQ